MIFSYSPHDYGSFPIWLQTYWVEKFLSRPETFLEEYYRPIFIDFLRHNSGDRTLVGNFNNFTKKFRSSNWNYRETIHCFCYSDYFVVIFWPFVPKCLNVLTIEKENERKRNSDCFKWVFDFKLQIPIMIDFFLSLHAQTQAQAQHTIASV